MSSNFPRQIDQRLPTFALLVVAALSARGDCRLPTWTAGSILTRAADRVHAADVNGDGAPDVIGHTASTIFVALNDGSGAFATATDVHSGTIVGPIVTGDFNGDTKVDIAFGTNGSLIVRPGAGNGAFGTAITTAITITPTSTIATNVDAGSTLDLLVYDAILAVLVRYTNDGSGQFAEASRTVIAANAVAFTAADFDGNGRTDSIVSYNASQNYDAFFAGANGAFGSPVIVGGTATAVALRAPDLDGSGRPDLLLATSSSIATLLNQGNGTFAAPVSYADSEVSDVVTADLSGDGIPDAVTVGPRCYIRSLGGSGTGTFTSFSFHDFVLSCSGDPVHAAIADFDGDSRNDLVLATLVHAEHKVRFLRNRCGESDVVATTPALATHGDDVYVEIVIRSPGEQRTVWPATGTVAIQEDGITLATGTLTQNRALIPVPGLALGTHELVAVYEGNESYEESVSSPMTVNIVTQSTTISLQIDETTMPYPIAPHIMATVTANGEAPAGIIRFTIDGVVIADDGAPVAEIPPFGGTPIGLGTHTVVARYLGDGVHPASTAIGSYTMVRQTPRPYATRHTAVAGQAQVTTINLTFSLGASYSANRPTGLISIGNGSTTYDSAWLQNGYASVTLTVPAMPAGRYTLVAKYYGDQYYTSAEIRVPWLVFPSSGESIDARGYEQVVSVTWLTTKNLLREKAAGQPWPTGPLPCCTTIQPSIASPPVETPYLYRMEGQDGSFTQADVGMRFTFTDDALKPAGTVKAIHLQEIVRAANLLRTAANLAPISSTPFSPGTAIRANALLALRTAINEARVALGAYPFTFSNTMASGSTILASDIQELREAVR